MDPKIYDSEMTNKNLCLVGKFLSSCLYTEGGGNEGDSSASWK